MSKLRHSLSTTATIWNKFRYPDDPIDKTSRLLDQLKWLEKAGFADVDVYWMDGGQAVFAGFKPQA